MPRTGRRRTTQRYRSGPAFWRMLAALGIVLSSVTIAVTPSPAVAAERLALIPIVSGLDAPVQVTQAGDGSERLFVVERPGLVRVVIDGQTLDTPFLDVTDRVHTDDSEQGLLALAFHPDYANNGELFVFYTANDWANTVECFTVSDDPNRVDPASGEVILALADREPNHNGGTLVFDADGMLLISTGDEGGGGDTYGNAQDLSSLFGKILRIDVDNGDPYAIPSDNPYVSTADARPEVWSYGLRNPWRISFDRLTGDLWVADVGQSMWEEVNHVPAGTGGGRNFGWNAMEGMHCYTDDCEPSLYTLPVAEYDHDDGCSITGGQVYRGSGWTMELELETDLRISSFGED
ncbi:MAG: PQQ-dependent sugar dehydrogenase, partial [Thermomicrobiales bacterium]